MNDEERERNNKLWNESSTYRAKIIRELEQEIGFKLPKQEFGYLVNSEKVQLVP